MKSRYIKHVFVTLFLLFAACVLYSVTTEEFLTNDLAKMRNTRETAFQLLSLVSNETVLQPDSDEMRWLYSAMLYFIGDYYEQGLIQKKKLYTMTKDNALIAVKLNPISADCHYWLGAGYAKWSEANGILDSLFYADDILNEMNRVIEIRPGFFRGVAWAIRAKVYNFAPGWPLSIGNKEQSYRDIETALSYGKDFRFIYQIHAEMLMNDGKYAQAKEVIDLAMVIPYDKNFPREEERIISDLNTYKKIVESRIPAP